MLIHINSLVIKWMEMHKIIRDQSRFDQKWFHHRESETRQEVYSYARLQIVKNIFLPRAERCKKSNYYYQWWNVLSQTSLTSSELLVLSSAARSNKSCTSQPDDVIVWMAS